MNLKTFFKYFKIFGLDKVFLFFIFFTKSFRYCFSNLIVTLILPFGLYFLISPHDFSPFTIKVVDFLRIDPN